MELVSIQTTYPVSLQTNHLAWFKTVKVNSVQEACAKCFVVHISKFEIMQIKWKNETKNIRLLVFSFLPINLGFGCILWVFFHMVCKISNFDMWTTKHLMQGCWTELALPPDFGRSVNTILIIWEGWGQTMPTTFLIAPSRIFRPSYDPVLYV